MTSPHHPLSTLLPEPEVARLVAETAPWWLWNADASRLIATNSSGARAMGATGVAVAMDRDYAPTHAFAGQIRRLAAQLADGGVPRSERLRVFGRFGSESVVAELRRIAAGGETLIAVRLPSMRRGEGRDAAVAFVGELPVPALIFDESGAPLGASSRATEVAGLALSSLLGAEHDRLAGELATAGRAVVPLVNGPLTVLRVDDARAIVAIFSSETVEAAPAGLRLVAGTEPVQPAGAPETQPAAEPEAADAAAEAAPVAPLPAISVADENDGADSGAEAVGSELVEQAPAETAASEPVQPSAAETAAPELVEPSASESVAVDDAASAESEPAEAAPVETADDEASSAEIVAPPAAPESDKSGQSAESGTAVTSASVDAASPTESEPAADEVEAPARFSWRLDSNLRFHAIDPATMAAPAGLSLADATTRYGLDPDGALGGAVSAARPFSGVPAVWPLGDAGRRLAVTLAAFPTLRDGTLQGYAGFGLVVEELARASRPVPAVEAPADPAEDRAVAAPEAPAEAAAAPTDDTARATGDAEPTFEQTPAASVDEAEDIALEPADLAATGERKDDAEPAASAEADEASETSTADATDGAVDRRDDAPAHQAGPSPVEAITGQSDGPAGTIEPPAAEPASAEPSGNEEAAADKDAVADRGPVEANVPSAPDERADNAFDDSAAPAAAENRPVLTVHTNPPNVVALRTSVGQDPRRPGLSAGERNAFREIARALGARTEGDDVAAPPRQDERSTGGAESPSVEPATQSETAKADDKAAGTPASNAPAAAVSAPDGQSGAETADKVEAAATDAAETVHRSADAETAPPATVAPTQPETSAPPVEPVAIIPPAFGGGLPPFTIQARPPARESFVDSGTPFGPLPSAFGATPAAEPAPPAAPLAGVAGDDTADMRALLDRVPAGLVVHRGNRILFANRTLLDWIGFADAEALERAGGIARLFAGDRSDVDAGSGSAVTITAKDGAAFAVDARLSKTLWQGESAFLFTLQRGAEPDGETESATLGELRGRLDEVEHILDTATDGIAIVNADGSIESMNRSAEALFGYESAEVKGRSITTLFAPESHRSALDYCDGLLSNGVASILNDGRQIIGRVKQGGLIPLYMTMGRTGPAAKPKLAAVFRDMTQWKKAEEELVAAKRQAERASSQKSDFLAKISHEIRTPLNAIIGFSEVMMEERFGPVGNERYRDYLKDIHSSGGHVLSLINDLLDLSKIEAGKLELAFTSVDLNDVIQSSVAIMQPQANRERVIIRSSLQAKLPNVVADARSLRQIVLNLLSNSIKFTPPGGQIIVSTALSDVGEAVLRVRDTGVGMTEVELRAAMEPFRQVATSNPHATKGTGLGLPLTKALVEANRASFGISSTPNQGTLVEVIFPPTRVLAE